MFVKPSLEKVRMCSNCNNVSYFLCKWQYLLIILIVLYFRDVAGL